MLNIKEVYKIIIIKKEIKMEYEIMYLCNFLGVSVLLAIALFTLVGVDKEKNTDTFEM